MVALARMGKSDTKIVFKLEKHEVDDSNDLRQESDILELDVFKRSRQRATREDVPNFNCVRPVKHVYKLL